jgi:hypothetical protein
MLSEQSEVVATPFVNVLCNVGLCYGLHFFFCFDWHLARDGGPSYEKGADILKGWKVESIWECSKS